MRRGLHGCATDPRRRRRGRSVARTLAAAVAAAALGAVALAGGAPAHVLYNLHAGESGAAPGTAAAGGPPAVIAPPDTVVGEADGTVDLEIRLSEPATDSVLVSYQTVGVTAGSTTSGSPNCSSDPDFVTAAGQLTFAPGDDSKVVQVQLVDCPGPEGLVSFRLELGNVSSNATIARATTLVSIVNNDIVSGAPKLFVRDAVADQQAGSVQVPVILGGPRGQSSTSTVTVHYATADGSGVAGVDYTATSGTLTFAPGQTVETILVPVNAGASPKASRTFSVTLSNPTNATVADAIGAVTIGSSAAAPVTTPELSAPPDMVVGEADGYLDLPVRLSAPGVNPVTVTYATSSTTAGAGTSCDADYVSTGSETITFLPGETTKVVRVQLLDCPEVEGLGSFLFTISNPANATISRATTLVSIVNDSTFVASPRLFARDAVVDEKDGSVRVPVLLGGPAGQTSTSAVTVHYATLDGTATAGVDYGSVSGTLSFAAGQTVKTVVVPILDNGPKPSRNFVLTLGDPTGGATIADGSGTIVIGASLAAAVPQPGISAPPDVVVGEADGYVDLPVRLSAPGESALTVNWSTSTGSASSGSSCPSDFVSTAGTLSFAPGETTKVVRVQLLDCPDVEGLVSFKFALGGQSNNATLLRASTLVSIVDDSTGVQKPRVFARDAVVDEKDGSVLVPILLGGPAGQVTSGDVTVHYETADGSALANTDYGPVSGTVSFAPGQTAKTIVVPIFDTGPKPTKRFTLKLSNVNANGSLADDTATVTIGASSAGGVAQPLVSAGPDLIVGEADGYVDLPVRLSAPGVNPVTVTYATSTSTASTGSSCPADFVSPGTGTLVFSPGETTKVVRVQLLDCAEVEGLASFLFTVSNPANATISRASTLVSIVNDSTVAASPRLFARDAVVDEKDGFVRVPVLLGGPAGQTSSNAVTVHYTTADGTAAAGVDYGSVSGTLGFAPGQTVKTVVVPILDNGPKPPRNFVLTLSDPTGGATIADGTGTIVIGASPAAAVPQPGISAPPDVVVGEADGYVDLPVRLSAPGQSTVSVTWGTSADAASSGTSCPGDFVSTAGTLTFAPGETTKVVRVQLLDCPDVEGLVSFRFTLGGQSNNAKLLRASTLVSVVDDSSPGSNPSVFARDAVVDEKDGNVLVPILLGGPAGQVTNDIVTVHYETADGSALANTDYGPVSGTVSFAPGQTAKTIVVPIFDTGPKPTKRFTLNLANVSSNATISDGTATVTIGARTAVPVAQPVISAGPDVIVGEADGYVDVPVRLSAPGTGPVTVTYAASNVTASSGNACPADYVSPGTGSLIFSPGETTKVVRVQLLDCADVESLISFKLALSNAANATIARTSTLVSIVNSTRLTAVPQLYVRDATVDEKDGAVLVPVLLGGAAGQAFTAPVTVSYTTADGSATAGTDYSALSGTLSFAPGQTVKNVVVPIADAGAKAPRTFAVTLADPTNASIADATGIVVIGSSDAPAVATPAVSAPADIAVTETDGYVDLPVTLAAPGTTAASVNYSTTGVTAHPGTSCTGAVDFVSTSGTLTFAAGETTKVVRVQLLDCPTVPGVVTFKLNLTTPVNATVPRPSATVSIVEDASAWTPNNTALPTLGGTPRGGQTLTADPGSWVGAPATFEYAWLRCDAAGASCGTIAGATDPTYALGPPDGGFTMRVEVVAKNGLGTGLPAYSAPTALVLSEPSAPQNVIATPGDGTATITFSPPEFGGGAPITSYEIAVSPGGTTVSDVTSPATIHGLANGTTYTFSVTATSSVGTSLPAVVTGTPRRVPDPPTGVVGTPGNGQVTVSFVAPAFDGGAPITSYTVTSSPGGVTATGSTSPITVTGLTNGTSYTFTVTATNLAGAGPASAASNAATPATVPGAPAGVAATAGNGQATVTFTPPASNGGAAIGSYTVTSSPGGFTATGGASPITVTGLLNGTSYTFTVTATNSAGTGPASPASTPVTPLTVPSAPTGVTVAPGNGRATVSFAAPASDGGSPITSYTVTASPGGVTATGGASPIVVTGLTNGTAYTFTVTAVNAVGASPPSAPSSADAPLGAPGVPTGVAATTISTFAVVTFTPPAGDGGSAITSYTVTVSPGGRKVTGTGSPIAVSGLTIGATYTFTVTATNTVGSGFASSASNPVTPREVRPADAPDPPPAAPRPDVPAPPSPAPRPPKPAH